jgi:hypothetical protein
MSLGPLTDMYTFIDLGWAFLAGILATLVAVTIHYSGGPPTKPRG